MNVPDVVRGDFVYQHALFANVGEMKRHPRASVAELTSLLRPDSSQKSTAAKDQVGHWYEAQLLHYGLPRSKEKNTAKMRLLQAINQGSLTVPSNILSMESEMKKEYAAASRKAKALSKATETSAADKAAPKGKKRKQDEVDTVSGTKTKVTIKVGDMSFDIEQSSANAQSTSTAAKKPAAKKQKQATDVTAPPTLLAKAKAKAPVKEKAPAKDKAPAKEKAPPKEKAPSEEKAPAKAKAPPKEKAAMTERAPGKKATSTKKAPIKREVKIEEGSNPLLNQHSGAAYNHPSEPMIKHEDYRYHNEEPESDHYHQRPSVIITGTYDLRAPKIEQQCTAQPDLTLVLRVNNERGKIWGKFELEFKSGVILITDIPAVANSDATTFGWRSRDENGGGLRFGRGCDGQVEFDGRGLVRGVFRGLIHGADIEFEGERREYESEFEVPHSVEEMEDEWDDFPRLAYGRE